MSVTALPDSRAALPLVAPHIRRTPLLASRTLSESTGLDVRLKAELFQRTGSYKIRGPLVKLARLSRETLVPCEPLAAAEPDRPRNASLTGIKPLFETPRD